MGGGGGVGEGARPAARRGLGKAARVPPLPPPPPPAFWGGKEGKRFPPPFPIQHAARVGGLLLFKHPKP